MNKIIGSGGGGSSGGESRTPVEAPDSLQSHQYAQILDLISEGPIRGLVNGLRSIYLDDTPIVAADGSANFSGVTVDTRLGTNDQAPIDGFASVDNEITVNTRVMSGTPVVRTVTGDVDSATVTIGIPQLSQTDTSTGDISGTSVGLSILVNNNGGGFQAVPMELRWGGESSEGVVSQTITLDNCYGIGLSFTVAVPVTPIVSDDFDPSGGGDSGYGGD